MDFGIKYIYLPELIHLNDLFNDKTFLPSTNQRLEKVTRYTQTDTSWHHDNRGYQTVPIKLSEISYVFK